MRQQSTTNTDVKLQSRAGQCTEVHFDSFLSGGFTTMALINHPKKKLAKHTSVQCTAVIYSFLVKKHPIILVL